MPSTFVVHYAEVALKGKNRPEFVRVLKRNLSRSLAGLGPQVSFREGRIFVTAKGPEGEVAKRIASTFGVAWFSAARPVEGGLEEIRSEVLDMARGASARTFKVDSRRSDKSFPATSHEIASSFGADIARETGMKVDLTHPEVTFHVDVTRGGAVVYSQKTPGPGGLPVGTAGRVMMLFSGGIDSPVAAWLLMKRGCVPVYVHFYLAPTPAPVLESKIVKLVKILAAYGGKATLVLVPFADYQLASMGDADGLEPSLFRRFMRMTCESLAPWFGASAVGTGDALSQAASQTLWNLASFDSGSSLPVLRPLLSYDKDEIVRLAKSIGTYDLSLEDYKDCCAIITRHPRTRVRGDTVSEAVERLGLHDLVTRVVGRATLVTYNPATAELKSSRILDSMAKAGLEGGMAARSLAKS